MEHYSLQQITESGKENYSSNLKIGDMKLFGLKIVIMVICYLCYINTGFAQVKKATQNNTIATKIPVGAIKINVKTSDSENQVYLTGQVNLTMIADTSSNDYGNWKSVAFDINDGLFICEEDQSWFNTAFIHHYGTELICIGITKNYYRVLVNKSGLSYWIKKSEFLKFETIVDYLKGFEVYLTTGQRIRTNADSNSPTIPIEIGSEPLNCEVIQVNGDWIQIKQSDNSESNTPKLNFKTGWIKWFERNELSVGLIDSY